MKEGPEDLSGLPALEQPCNAGGTLANIVLQLDSAHPVIDGPVPRQQHQVPGHIDPMYRPYPAQAFPDFILEIGKPHHKVAFRLVHHGTAAY